MGRILRVTQMLLEDLSLRPFPGSPTRDYSLSKKWTICVGTITSPDGSKYVGKYRNGLPNGQGTLTSANGRIREGIWKDNKFQYAKKDPKIKLEEERLAREKERKEGERLARRAEELKRKEGG